MASSNPRRWRPVRTPTVLQMEAAECGAAALGIILEYHGRYVPLDLLRDDCGVSRDGSNALYIKEAAKRYGLEAKVFRRQVDGLISRRPPFIVFWRWNHFLVVEGFARGKVFINDPASGRRTIGADEFERSYSGIAFTFETGPQFTKQGRRPSALLGLVRRLSTSKTALVFVILAGLALVIPNLVSAGFQRVFIDEILVAGHRDWLKPLLLAMGLTALLRLAAAALQQVYLMRLEVRLTLDESLKFLGHMLRLPVTFFQHRFTGDLVARASSTARVAELISGELATTAVSLLTLVFYVAVMLPYDPLLTIVGVGISSVNLVALKWFSRWRTDRNRAIEQIRGRLMAGVMWAIQIMESVKATGSESELLVRWTGEQARMSNAEQTLGVCDTLLFLLPPLLASLTTIMVLGLGGRQVFVGGLSIGVLVAFQSLLAGFNQPFLDLARLGADVQELRADLDRIDDVRNRPIDAVFASSALLGTVSGPIEQASVASTPHRLSGHVEFRRVTFGYNRTIEEPLIKEFSFVALPGQRIALVGGTGSGKSTIGRLAAGLYQPWSGEILYDGKALSQVSREVFVKSVELVDSEICLFEGSVRDNLTLWDELVHTDRQVQAGVDAAIHRDLLNRRGGYGAAVAEQGRNFSGGQRQRLQIARALVRDPSFLILDEATSALDPKTERIVDDNLRRRGCTCLIIAHRLTTIRDCDEIIVMSAGRVVQRGTHDELIADTGGEYARLVSHQALPGPRSGSFSRARRRPAPQPSVALDADSDDQVPDRHPLPAGPLSDPFLDQELDSPRFIVEELLPYSQSVRTAANLPLPLDDAEAVWWVSSGGVDVFFTQLELGAAPGQRRHLCRVEEGGSIFAISGVRGRSGGGLVAVGAGPAQLLKFARGDLIRLSFEEGLSEQVAVLIDDWVLRAGRALARFAGIQGYRELELNSAASLEPGARFGVREGVAWVRHLSGTSLLLDQVALPVTELEARFPVTEHLWLTAATACNVTACDTTTMIRSSDPWAGLDDFHRTLLDFVSGINEHETRTRGVEFRRALAHETALVESVSSRLAAAANGISISAVDPGGDSFLTACRTVGQSLGIEVRSPQTAEAAGSEPATDPLGDLARASGFHVRPVTLGAGWWRHGASEPLLGRFADESNTHVALVPARAGAPWSGPSYELRDPEGRSHKVDDRLAARIAPSAWVFYRSLPDRPLGMSDLLRFSLSLRNLTRELWMVVAMAMLTAVFGLSIPIAAGILVDQVIPEADLNGLGVMCLFLVVLTFSATIFQAIQGLLVLRIEGRISATLIPAVWDRLVRLPTRFFAQFTSGDLALRAMEFSTVFKKISGAVVTTLVTGLFSFANLGLLFYYSWRLALCTSVLLGVMLSVTVLLLAGLLRQEISIRRIDGLITGLLLELLGGIITLRTAGAESRAFTRWAGRYTERLTLSIKARRFANRIHLWLAVYPILTAMVIYFGTVHLDSGLMRAGSFLAFTITFANLIAAVLAVGYTSIGLLELLPMFQRIKPILEERPEFAAAVLEPVRLTGALALNHVSFRYPGQDQGTKVLDNVSLQVRPGEFVAIVGPSGSGKSTLMRLLLGFETPDSGTVTYDGRELATLDLRGVRRQIGVVLQQAQLMPTDIFSNIVGLAPFLNMDDAWQAARLAGLEDDIRRMPMEMHTLVGEGGGNLSSGQRQRLLIARAIVRRPKILLLDEATSALDNVTQAIVSDSLTNQLRGVTRVVIAHRLDVVVKADRIYVLKDCRIIQSGPYHQLLEEPGPFRDLARRQML
jgi:NHLM bacteriocin system ABC transporter peptidase/ATP-binding protein/NHLM bacteriocin system ABC transporter ATP-binding protein